jgi:hypothetical protein
LEQAMTEMAVDAWIKSGHDGLEVVANCPDMRGPATHDAFNTA